MWVFIWARVPTSRNRAPGPAVSSPSAQYHHITQHPSADTYSLCFKESGLHQCTKWQPLNARPSKNTSIHYAADGKTSAMLLGRAAVVYLFSVPTTPTVYMFSRLFQHSQCSNFLLAQIMES